MINYSYLYACFLVFLRMRIQVILGDGEISRNSIVLFGCHSLDFCSRWRYKNIIILLYKVCVFVVLFSFENYVSSEKLNFSD